MGKMYWVAEAVYIQICWEREGLAPSSGGILFGEIDPEFSQNTV